VLLKRKSKSHVYAQHEIKEAALMALYYSSARRYGKEEVLYTQAKNVKKASRSPVGTVTVASGKVLLVTLEEKALKKALTPKE